MLHILLRLTLQNLWWFHDIQCATVRCFLHILLRLTLQNLWWIHNIQCALSLTVWGWIWLSDINKFSIYTPNSTIWYMINRNYIYMYSICITKNTANILGMCEISLHFPVYRLNPSITMENGNVTVKLAMFLHKNIG